MLVDLFILTAWVALMVACVINSTILTINELTKGIA